jgi:D-xylose transport system substrate-binding protein
MKHHRSALLGACLGALLVTESARAAEGVRIGVSLPTQREERWVRDRKEMEAAARSMGVDLRVQVTDNDASKQLDQCENLISQGVKVLILAPHDSSSAAVIVDKAVQAGVTVISYDRLVRGSTAEYFYLSFDNLKVGQLQGEFLTGKVKRGNYVVLAGSPTDNNARLFHAGAMEKIAPLVKSGHVRIVMEQWVKDWQPSEAQRLMEQALTASGNRIDGVLAPNDGTAGGVIQALAAQGLAGKVPVTGQDAEATAAIRILQGTQSMTIFKDTRELARKGIEMAVDLAQGRPIDTQGRTISNGKRDVPSVLLRPEVVTRENLEDVLVKTGWLDARLIHRG